jgi:FMN reductase
MAHTVDETIAEVLERSLAGVRTESPLQAVAISGSPRSPSKSRALAARLLLDLEKLGCDTHLVDVATLPADALLAREQSPEVDLAIAAIGRAQIVAASSPTYRALYTGALKCLFDLMPQSHLAGKICLGIQTGIAPAHALSPEYGLRPLFSSLDGVPALTLYATDSEFAGSEPDEKLADRIAQMAETAVQLARGLGAGEA